MALSVPTPGEIAHQVVINEPRLRAYVRFFSSSLQSDQTPLLSRGLSGILALVSTLSPGLRDLG